jgi:DNA-binding FadR family transcriptional regulator
MNRLRQNKLHEQLAAQLGREIVSGRIEAGSPIPSELDLVGEHGVSKTVVRETVQALAGLGLVRVQHGKRTVVLPESEWDILSGLVQEAYHSEGLAGPLIDELYEVRLALEPQAARWTAERARARDREQIGRTIEDMRSSVDAALAGEGNERFLADDRELHLRIATAASNRVLRAIVRDIHELLTTSWRWSVLSPEEIKTAYRQHVAIADAITSGNGDAAEATMKNHLEWAVRTDRCPGRLEAAPAPTGRQGSR